MDLLIKDTSDSFTIPKVKLPDSGSEESTVNKEDIKVQVKIQNVFSQTQLCIFNHRFQNKNMKKEDAKTFWHSEP
jgi:hypothetical protein